MTQKPHGSIEQQVFDKAQLCGAMKVIEWYRTNHPGIQHPTQIQIGNLFGRTDRWVRNHQQNDKMEDCKNTPKPGRPLSLTAREQKMITTNVIGKKRKSCRRTSAEFEKKKQKSIHPSTVQRYRKRAGK